MKSQILPALISLLFVSVSNASISATYTVPVNSPVATTDVTQITIGQNQNGVIEIKYTLSDDLTGPKADEIHLNLTAKISNESQTVLKLKDPNGPAWAICNGLDTGLNCTVDYEMPLYDLRKVERHLVRKYSDNRSLLNEKLLVARTLGTDPVGVLAVTCDQANCGL